MGSLPNYHGYKRGSRLGAGVMLPFLEERKAYKFQDETRDRLAQVAISVFLDIHS